MRDPRLLDWHFGEPTPILPAPAGRRPSRRPLPHPSRVPVSRYIRSTAYVVPWWQRDLAVTAAVAAIVFAAAYLLAHVLVWIARGLG